MSKLLIPLKLPFLVIRELLILVLKYCYGCTVIKQSLSLAAERADGTIDLDNLSATAREQLTMVLQLMKE